MTRLQRLDVTALRGIVGSSLAFDGGSVILGGGNGMGKSAYVDALEFLYTGTISSLSGAAGLSVRQHAPHISATVRDAHVSGLYDDPALSITRWLSGQVDVPVALDRHLRDGGRIPFILRRGQLQQFIHATPADRYRSMAELIAADNLSRTEMHLKRAADTLESAVQGLEAQYAQVERQLEHLPPEEPGDDVILREAAASLGELGFAGQPIERFEDLSAVRAGILRSVAANRQDPGIEGRMRMLELVHRGVEQRSVRAALDGYREVAAAGNATSGPAHLLDLLQVLRRGRNYLLRINTSQCPLCEQRVEGQALLTQLNARIADLETVGLQQQRLDAAREEVDAAVRETAERLQAIDRLAAELGLRRPPATDSSVAMLRESLRSGAAVEAVEMSDRFETALDRWETWAREIGAHLDTVAEAEERSGEADAAAGALAIIEQVRVRRAQSERGRQERERLEEERARLETRLQQRRTTLRFAQETFRTFNRIKNEEIQAVFDELQADLASFYDFLHPGEGHGLLGISMDPRKRGSSELRMGFYQREREDPRAFSSEGHLDSLGLCIFLAFVKRFSGDWPLLVLDDVVTSVDAAHKQRVARLLFEEFADRQMFITTHDSRWFLDLKRIGEEMGIRDVRSIVIESWSLGEGPRLRPVA